MNTRRCQTCCHWDVAQRLERTTLGDLAPCTRSAPFQYNLANVFYHEPSSCLPVASSAEVAADPLGGMKIPLAIWPYTDAAQVCGDYHPCDLEENARRNKMRQSPLC